MRLAGAQKSVISNIFRDLTKLAVAALVFGQFVPGQIFNLSSFIYGALASLTMLLVAVAFATD